MVPTSERGGLGTEVGTGLPNESERLLPPDLPKHLLDIVTTCSRLHNPPSRVELVELGIAENAAIWVRNADVPASVAHEFNGLFDGRCSGVPLERQCPG